MPNKYSKIIPIDDAAVIYARYSTENQKEQSIEAQKRACKEYAEKNALEIVGEYIDRAKSGTNTEKRNALQKMLEDSKSGKFSKVIVFSLDRFSRNLRDYLNSVHELNENGVSLRSVTEHIDDSYSGRVLATILMLNAEMYISNLAGHIKKNQREAARKGLYTGGNIPLGYMVNSDKEFVINEEEARVVRKIFEMYSKGHSYGEIIERLNIEGYQTKAGNKFVQSSLYSILKNEKYIGTYTHGENGDDESETEKQIVLKDKIPPIVGKDLFDKVQQRLNSNKQSAGRNKSERGYILSGLVQCGMCGVNMQVNTSKAKGKAPYSSYRCPNAKKKECENNKSIRRKFVERYVLDKIFRNLFAKTSLKEITSKFNEHVKVNSVTSNDMISHEQTTLDDIIKKLSNLTESVKKGLTSKTIEQEIESLENDKKVVKKRIKELERKHTFEPLSEKEVFALIRQIRNTATKKDKAPEISNFMNAYVDKILVNQDEVEVRLKLEDIVK